MVNVWLIMVNLWLIIGITSYVVGGLEHLDFFPYILGIIIPTDFHIFRKG